MTTGTFRPGYQPAFGRVMTTSHEQKEEIRRIEGETGKEIHEIGNDTTRMEKPTQKVDIKSAVQELKRAWQR